MLTELRIENFAIISALEIRFQPGLTTFTGETGAGKSIILDAIMALVGGKTDAGDIRAGAERASVEAEFRIPPASRDEITAILQREALEEDGEHITLARELRREGRSVARINGRAVSLGLLRELGAYLVDIHGQSEHLSLLDVRQHLGLLDRYAESGALLAPYRSSYQRLQSLRRSIHSLRQAEQEARQRQDLLAFQAQEIETARLQPGEEDDLTRERDRLANAEALASHAQQALTLLEEGTPENPALSDLLGGLVENLAALGRLDASQSALAEQAENLAESLSDLGRELRDYQEQIEFNPRRLEQVEERLHLIQTLKKKYGGSIQSALDFGREARQKLESIETAGEQIALLEAEEAALLDELATQAAALSQRRRQAAGQLGQAVEAQLADLSMNGARFMVELGSKPDPQGLPVEGERVAFNENGIDQVEFMIAPNPGEGFKPLVKIASGGETSRLMLALKNVLAGADHIPTLIFDEIDQGIGGRVGMVVGEKLWQLGRQHQVLVVTHLPQLAAFGGQHYGVQKQLEGGRTSTRVYLLDGQARLDELAAMLGNLTDANLSAAQ
ncbi:MAG: DNA repair protein RecN, partial [Anaerolineae bacterium]|nr:DNA repair protein RecN [Anaerolineae bacterium]